MATFLDKNKKKWVLEINTTVLKRAKARDFDIPAGIADGSLMEKCCSDDIYLVDLICVLCSKQCETEGVSEESFGELVGCGDAIQGAVDALIEALSDFYREKLGPVKKAMDKYKQLVAKTTEVANMKMEAVDVDQMVEKFGESLTSALESAE